MTKLLTMTALLAVFSMVTALPDPSKRDVVDASDPIKRDPRARLDQNADDIELRFQPVLDFDKDACYQTSAVDPSSNYNPGLPKDGGSVTGGCRDQPRLENSNTYSRRRCNNGVCGIIYAYYYEKDYGNATPSGGHRHDWEHVAVFADMKTNKVIRAAYSAHGDWHARGKHTPLVNPNAELINPEAQPIPFNDAGRVKVVYHKDGLVGTHAHRFAKKDEQAENFSNAFYQSPLVGWLGYPSDKFRESFMAHGWGSATIEIKEDRFAAALKNAGAAAVGLNPDGPDE